MVSDNDLYDISEILKVFKMNINDEHNYEILDEIIKHLENYNIKPYYDNEIRVLLSNIVNSTNIYYEFAFKNNFYVHRIFLKDEKIYNLLISLFKHLKGLIKEENFCQAIDFLDAIHVLPEILVYHHFRIPPSYWRIYLKPYKKKWKVGRIY